MPPPRTLNPVVLVTTVSAPPFHRRFHRGPLRGARGLGRFDASSFAKKTFMTQPATMTGRVHLLTRERLETLLGLSQEFNATLDLAVLLPRILELTLSVTESEAASLWVVEQGRIRCAHAHGPAASRLVGGELA